MLNSLSCGGKSGVVILCCVYLFTFNNNRSVCLCFPIFTVPSENKMDKRSVEETMNEIRAKKKQKVDSVECSNEEASTSWCDWTQNYFYYSILESLWLHPAPGLSPAKIMCRLNLTTTWIKRLNQVAIVAFYSCFEEQKCQFGIIVPVSKA